MNLLEVYIVEIHSEKPYTEGWTKKFDKEFVEVDVTTNCYGSVKRNTTIWTTEELKKYKEDGYYMG